MSMNNTETEEVEENDPNIEARFSINTISDDVMTNRPDITSYRDKEIEMREEYYRSNPLRLFVSSVKGQTILPQNFTINKKKALPKIYSELRVTDDLNQDRDMHKEKMRAHLKLSLNVLDNLNSKSTIDLMDYSKKIYNDYCKNNLTKPVDFKNVESVIKTIIKTRKGHRTNSPPRVGPNSVLSQPINDGQDFSVTKSNKTEEEDKLEIDAQNLPLKNFDDFSKEMRNRKFVLAKFKDNQSYRAKYDDTPVVNQKHAPQQHKGSIYNYQQAKSNLRRMLEKENLDEIEKMHMFNEAQIFIQQNQENTNFHMNSLNKEFASESNLSNNKNEPTYILSNPISPDQKYQQRIQHARDKILAEQSEKTNLNKMTILNPFEDTKILINIDKVPSHVLNNLLNKQTKPSSYYMPPTRGFGYFKKVVTTSEIAIPKKSMTPRGDLSSKRSQLSGRKDILTQNAKYESLKSLSEMRAAYRNLSDELKNSNERNKRVHAN